jgi:thioredoxin-related protein
LLRVDTVSSAELSEYFQIEVTPTLISYLNGEAFERVDGTTDDEELEDVIQTLIDQVRQDA